jgi:predicted nucleic acid-binding Zn ribbon protein
MDPKIKHIFCNIQIEPRPHLCEDICRVIVLREKRSRMIRFSGYSIITITSLAAIVPATLSLFHQFGQSGFTQYASLVISDSGILAGYWKQFAVTLVESIPGVSLAVVLVVLLVLVWSARSAIRQIKPSSPYHLQPHMRFLNSL